MDSSEPQLTRPTTRSEKVSVDGATLPRPRGEILSSFRTLPRPKINRLILDVWMVRGRFVNKGKKMLRFVWRRLETTQETNTKTKDGG